MIDREFDEWSRKLKIVGEEAYLPDEPAPTAVPHPIDVDVRRQQVRERKAEHMRQRRLDPAYREAERERERLRRRRGRVLRPGPGHKRPSSMSDAELDEAIERAEALLACYVVERSERRALREP